MTSELKVMCWNINEGRGGDPKGKVDAALGLIAAGIRSKSPDIVLLNEVRNPGKIKDVVTFFIRVWRRIRKDKRVDQTEYLKETLGFPHAKFLPTNQAGDSEKGVAILSRIPFDDEPKIIPVRHKGRTTKFGTMVATFMVGGKRHHVLSTRLAPHNDHGTNREENKPGILHALKLVQSFAPDEPIIFGGDFNASTDRRATNEYEETMETFFTESNLKEVLNKDGLYPVKTHRVDYIFYRGPYEAVEQDVANWAEGDKGPKASDHDWIYAVLKST